MTFYQGSNGRVAVVLPGRAYTPNHPVLYYTREVLRAEGWSVEEVWWNPEDLLSEDAVITRASQALTKVADQKPLVVGKSLGSLALPIAAARGWPAIWLTPLLYHPDLISALKVATSKMLLVGGTADDSWNGTIAKESGLQVLELPGADHSLEMPGDPLASVGLLREFVVAITSFLQGL